MLFRSGSDVGISNDGQLTVANSTFSGNGVGISNAFGEFVGVMDMSNSTVANNLGDGIDFGPALTSSVRNSIFAGNGGEDCSGGLISGDYNLIQKAPGCEWFGGGGHNITGVAAKLGPLSWTGGWTETMKPLHGSPAINGGDPAGCKDSSGQKITQDQRGFPRPYPAGGRCDIGAVELQ